MHAALPGLYRIACRPRWIVCGWTLPVCAAGIQAGTDPRALVCLPWGVWGLALLAALLARTPGSQSAMWRFQWFEALVVTLLVGVTPLRTPEALGLLGALVLSNAGLGGPRLLLQTAACAVAAAVLVRLGGLQVPVRPPSGYVAVSFGAGLVTGYALLLALLAFEQSLRQARERRALERVGERLGQFLPVAVARRVVAGAGQLPPALLPARRALTVVFLDLCGFTRFAERADVRTLRTCLDAFQRLVRDAAAAHGGTVDKFIGDGAMVIFGHPDSVGAEGDARSAVRFLGHALACWPPHTPARGDPEWPGLRGGAHCGDCVVGCFGTDRCIEYTAVGSVVNLASRLEQAAPAGLALISGDLRSLAQPAGLVSAGGLRLKGVGRPVAAWIVKAESAPVDTGTTAPGTHPPQPVPPAVDGPHDGEPGLRARAI